MRTSQKGSIAPLLIILLVLVVIAIGVYIYYQNLTRPQPVSPQIKANSLPVPNLDEGSLGSEINGTTVTIQAGTKPGQVWDGAFTVPPNAEYLSFDFKWLKKGNSWLTLQYGDETLFNFSDSVLDAGQMENSGPIGLTELVGKTDQLLFTLNSKNGESAMVQISNLKITYESLNTP